MIISLNNDVFLGVMLTPDNCMVSLMSQLIQVYSRLGCHLCDEMIEHLNILKEGHPFEFEIIEITGDSALEEKFGVKVPVLMINDSEICHYFLDVTLLKKHLNKEID